MNCIALKAARHKEIEWRMIAKAMNDPHAKKAWEELADCLHCWIITHTMECEKIKYEGQ